MERCRRGAGEVLAMCWQGAGQVLERRLGGAGGGVGNVRGGAAEVLERRWVGMPSSLYMAPAQGRLYKGRKGIQQCCVGRGGRAVGKEKARC